MRGQLRLPRKSQGDLLSGLINLALPLSVNTIGMAADMTLSVPCPRPHGVWGNTPLPIIKLPRRLPRAGAGN